MLQYFGLSKANRLACLRSIAFVGKFLLSLLKTLCVLAIVFGSSVLAHVYH